MSDNLKLWSSVEKTDPKYTKEAKIGGMKITAIAPQYQIRLATEQFGPYGKGFGFKEIELDYSLVSSMQMVVFKGKFFYPGGEFVIINSSKLYMDRAQQMVDAEFAKKIETDALTKALSKLGFNADVFMGRFDDHRYVDQMREEFKEPVSAKELAEAEEALSRLQTHIEKNGFTAQQICESYQVKALSELTDIPSVVLQVTEWAKG